MQEQWQALKRRTYLIDKQLCCQQRADFLKIDLIKIVKAANAFKISDIANMNFTAEQQIALENARMAHSRPS